MGVSGHLVHGWPPPHSLQVAWEAAWLQYTRVSGTMTPRETRYLTYTRAHTRGRERAALTPNTARSVV